MSDTTPGQEWHRSQGIELFNGTWGFLDAEERSPEDDLDMLTAVLASRHHWRVAGEPKNHAISDWQVSRVFSELGDGEMARRFAGSSLAIVEEHGLEPFLAGSAHEALARAAALLGDGDAFDAHLAAAHAVLESLIDEDDREVLATDIEDAEALR